MDILASKTTMSAQIHGHHRFLCWGSVGNVVVRFLETTFEIITNISVYQVETPYLSDVDNE